jgi:hypothetical protein
MCRQTMQDQYETSTFCTASLKRSGASYNTNYGRVAESNGEVGEETISEGKQTDVQEPNELE